MKIKSLKIEKFRFYKDKIINSFMFVKHIAYIFFFFINIQQGGAFPDVENKEIKDSIEDELYKHDKASHFELYTNLSSKVTYAGRYYGVSGMAINIMPKYHFENGFNLSIANYIWPGFETPFTQSDINVSYANTFFSLLDFEAGYTRMFMYYGSDSDRTALNNAININATVNLKYVNTSFEYAYYIGTDKASMLIVGLNKEFSIYKKLGAKKITFTPNAKIYWGSQTIYYHYFSKNQVHDGNNGKGKGKGNQTSTTQTINYKAPNNFQILNYQLSFVVGYRLLHWNFEAGYYVDFPCNLPADYVYTNAPISYFIFSAKYYLGKKSKNK